jgi:hypothetical protein
VLVVESEGTLETLAAFRGLEADLRKQANAELRAGARLCAEALVVDLQAAASASGVPVAARVASSAKVKSDRLPSVTIGGSKRVGRRGAPASELVWGSEHGGNNFAAPAGGAYWIKPTVERFGRSRAVAIYRVAIAATAARWGLL